MKSKIYIALSIALGSLLMSSCATDTDDNDAVLGGEDAFALSAMSLTADAVRTPNLFLTAKLNEDPSITYIGETSINIPALSGTPSLIIFPVVKPTYPLADKAINIYAYTGKTSNGKMVLKAGQSLENDAILSNNGQRGVDPILPENEGNGTLGSASNPASLLQFRHVMTQINVKVEVDLNEKPEPVDPIPTSVKIQMRDLVAQGSYEVTAKAPLNGKEAEAAKATNTSGSYTLQLGTNYVIPNGQNLKGEGFTSLVIDDYTATAADLQGYTIQPQGGASDFYLLPGYSYNLTLTVSRLKVTGIKLTTVPWKPQEVKDTDVTYAPYSLDLDLGDYNNIGEDQVTKVVLYTSDEKTYVGALDSKSPEIEFVTIPATGKVTKADLYTKKGLLISSNIDQYEKQNKKGKLSLKLSVGGMIPEIQNYPINETNGYLITTALQFLNIDKDLASHYKQGASINMSTLQIDNFAGLGEFKGSFNGNGYLFSSVNMTGAGLFKINSGSLKNIRIYTGKINAKGADFAGAIAGVNNGTIVACFNEASIVNSTGTVGGIVGKNTATGEVIASLNTGVIPQGSVVGGIIGTNENTNAGAISANVNIGTLNSKASKLGGIAGTSLPSSNSIMNSCYWLIGSAERYIGSKETAVDSDNVTRTDTSSRDTNEMRNGISAGDPESERIVNKLNAEISNIPIWKNVYQYVLDPLETGSTWPIPSKK